MCHVLGNRDAFRLEGAEDGGVMDEVTEDRERPGVSVLERERDGITNAETHAEMGSSENAHNFRTSLHKELCDVKCPPIGGSWAYE